PHVARASGARRPRRERERDAALRRGSRGRRRPWRDALLRVPRRARGPPPVPGRRGVQVRNEDGPRRGARPTRRRRPLRTGRPRLRGARRRSGMTGSSPSGVTLAIPCRTDEPALDRTLAAAAASWEHVAGSATTAFEVFVCLNGEGGAAPRGALRRFADEIGAPFAELDANGSPVLPPAGDSRGVVLLVTRRAGKPIAWNVLRRHVRTPLAVFVDADVSFGPDAFPLLLAALEAHPEAILASAKTTCAPRATRFERVMAAPYAIDFPNLSAQLYAARVAGLPATMPEDLIEPERWLELVVGRDAVVREPAARDARRLLPPARPDRDGKGPARPRVSRPRRARRIAAAARRRAPEPRLAGARAARRVPGSPDRGARGRVASLSPRPRGRHLAPSGDDEEMGSGLTTPEAPRAGRGVFA